MRGSGGFLLLVLVIFTVVKYWVWIAAAVGIVVALVVLWKMTGWLGRRLDAGDAKRAARAAELAAIAARADEQNRLFLAGDERGFYGEYGPKQTA
jgi:hypothetical protein